jgi:integrase
VAQPPNPLPEGVEARQTKAGPWRYRGYLYDSGKKVTGPWCGNPADARGWRIKAEAAQLDGPLRATTTETVKSASDRFLAGIANGTIHSKRRKRYANSTVRSYRRLYRTWINPELGHIPVDRLRRSQVQRFVDHMVEQDSGNGTIRNTWAGLAALYSWLLPRHDGLADPTDGVILPRPAEPRDKYVRPERIDAYLTALPKHLQLPFALAFYAGLRKGEAQALMHSDIDDEWITVQRSLDPQQGFKPTKSDETREVPILDSLRPYLPVDLEGFLLPSRRPSRWGVQTLGEPYYRRCREAWEQVNLPPITLHTARHSFVTALVRAGYDVKLVQEWAGHADPTTTLRIYTKARGRESGLADRMNAYLAR